METTYWEYELTTLSGGELEGRLNLRGQRGWEVVCAIGSGCLLMKRQIEKPQPTCLLVTRKPTWREAAATWLQGFLRSSVKHV